MTTLVTGGSGYIGSALVRRLLHTGADVRVLSLPGTESGLPHHPRLRWIPGTVTDLHAVRSAASGCGQIYHLAALACPWTPSKDDYFRVNVGGTETVLSTARELGVPRVLHVSSNVVFGPSTGEEIDEATPRLIDYDTAYERSKVAAERVVQHYVRSGAHVVIVNPTRVFGPGPLSESNAVTQMISWYLDGTWRWILGPGTAVGNYVFLPDLLDGLLGAMQRGRTGENYLIGGDNVCFNDFFATLAEVSGIRRRMIHLPPAAALAFARCEGLLADRFGKRPLITLEWTQTFLRSWPNSIRKASEELGYRPKPFHEALAQTVSWLQRQRVRGTETSHLASYSHIVNSTGGRS